LILFGFPLAVTLPVTIGLWLALGQSAPESLLLPVALLLTPSFWLGAALAVFIGRYEKSARLATLALPYSADISRKTLRKLERTYAFREWLARSYLRNAVYIGYFLMYARLKPATTSHALNPYRGGHEEIAQDRLRQQRGMFSGLCQLVYFTATVGGARPAGVLDECINMLPVGPCKERIGLIVKHAFTDGPGFLSTLTSLTYVHYFYSLPTPFVEDIEATLTTIQFDPAEYGWLGNRALEAVIYLRIQGLLLPSQIITTLQPILDQVTGSLSACTSTDATMHAKWEGRRLLRQAAGIGS
jgi:hypothetical protein